MSTQYVTEEHPENISFIDSNLQALRDLRLRGAAGNLIGLSGGLDVLKNVFSKEPDLIEMTKGGLKLLAAVAISSTGKR